LVEVFEDSFQVEDILSRGTELEGIVAVDIVFDASEEGHFEFDGNNYNLALTKKVLNL
jgi:hypothetical protein